MPRDLPHPGIEPASVTSPALAGGFFTTRATWDGDGCDSSGQSVSSCGSLSPIRDITKLVVASLRGEDEDMFII